MVERSLGFPAAEYRARTERLQAVMRTAGQDALVLTVPADMAVGTKLKVIDAVGEGTFVEFEVVAKPQ